MSRFGDPEDEPITFLASRFFAGVVGMVLVGTYLGDPLWLSLLFGVAAGGMFASSALLVRKVFAD